MKSVNDNIDIINKIYSKSYWWAERYDYLESLSGEEIKELSVHLKSKGSNLAEQWKENKGFCDHIIQKRREKKLKQIGIK